MTGKKTAHTGWHFILTTNGWHWELFDENGNWIGRSIMSFPTKQACYENALAHSRAKRPFIEQETNLTPEEERDRRNDIHAFRSWFAMKQQAFSAGFAEGSESSAERHGVGEEETWYVYMLSSGPSDVLMLKAENTLEPHVNKAKNGSAAKHAKVLVWCEWHDSKESAMSRLKEMRKWSRQRKIGFIEATNPGWNDISESFLAG